MGLARRRGLRLLAGVLLVVAAACSSGGDDEAEPEPAPRRSAEASSMFALLADGGTFQTNEQGRVTVSLTGVAATVVRFADRPAKAAGSVRTETFVAAWHAVFGDDPPTAALVLTEGDPQADVVVFTLERPRYDQATGTLEFEGALRADADAAGRLGLRAGQVDQTLPERFGAVSLFVDGSGAAPPAAAFYVTFSGVSKESVTKPIQNVVAYTTTGEAVPTPVLVVPSEVDLERLRGMTFDANSNLYVANATESTSTVLSFGTAGPDGSRTLLEGNPFTSYSDSNPGLLGPYGLGFDLEGNLLASSPETLVVTRVGIDGVPTPVAPWLESTYPGIPFLPGTVVPSAAAGPEVPPPPPTGLQGPRGVAVSPDGTLYVADAAAQKVRAYDVATGTFLADVLHKDINDGQPVGLLLAGSALFVSNEGTDNVVAVDLTDNTVVEAVAKQTGDVVLDRPSGLAAGPDGALYVASRGGKQILRYDLAAGTGSVFVDNLTDEPEHLVALPSISPAIKS